MEKIILVGGGDLAKKVIQLNEREKTYEIIGYTDSVDSGKLFGIKYLGNDEELMRIKNSYKNIGAIVCFGGNVKSLNKRIETILLLENYGYQLVSLISSKANVNLSVRFGEGTIVFDGAYVDYNVNVGKYSLININATVCHDVLIGNNCIISPATVIGGAVKIGNNCFIGMNSTINPYLIIKDEVGIGSGAVVTKSIFRKNIYVGNPAKPIYKGI